MRFLVILVGISMLVGCLPFRAMYLTHPDAKDLKRIHAEKLKASEDSFHFAKEAIPSAAALKINDWSKDIPFFLPLQSFVKTHKLRSFLIIQEDTIRFEHYGAQTSEADIHPSYSIAKSFTSVLIGIAIDEGLIKSEKDLVMDYLPELKSIAPEFEVLQIEHLLNHTSGIKYSLALDATIYYGNNTYPAFKRIQFQHSPGSVQHYLNINVHLLGAILVKVTKNPLHSYLQEKIWTPLGMESDGLWLTGKKDKLGKAFCCIGATARDYAKFGRLFLHKGEWDGQQIVSPEWYHKSIRRDTSSGSSFNYNYCWHIGLKEYGDFMAIGLYKQHIYINPNKKLIIVTLSNKENRLWAERVNWWYIFRQIADQY